MSRYCLIPESVPWQRRFGVDPEGLPRELRAPRYNICRDQWLPVIRSGAHGRELTAMRWGFVPHWVRSKNPRLQPLTVHDNCLTKPYYRDAFENRRCLVPMSGYYGWSAWENGPGLPYYIRLVDREAFLVAGIWDTWNGADRVAIVTTSANAKLLPIYERMPVIVPAAAAGQWLGGRNVADLLRPYPAAEMEAFKVVSKLFRQGSEGPELIEAAPEDDSAPRRAVS